MTPCEKLGYKVGDRFVSQKTNKMTGLRKGGVLILKHDDGSDIPWFLCEETEENIPVTLSWVVKQDTNPRIKTGYTIERDGKKYRVTLEEIPQYEFKPGMLCRVVWDGSEACVCRSNDDDVVFIQSKGKEYSEIAYAMDGGGTCVGYVKTSNLRPE